MIRYLHSEHVETMRKSLKSIIKLLFLVLFQTCSVEHKKKNVWQNVHAAPFNTMIVRGDLGCQAPKRIII